MRTVLAYLWILALIPFLFEKDDEDVKWHAKHGLVLMGVEAVVWIVIRIGLFVTGGLILLLAPFVFVGFIILRIVCILYALNGQRLQLPWLKPLVDDL